MKTYIDRRHIGYRPPFAVETLGAFHIGVDANGYNCARFAGSLAIGSSDKGLLDSAVDALNAQPVSDFIEAEIAA